MKKLLLYILLGISVPLFAQDTTVVETPITVNANSKTTFSLEEAIDYAIKINPKQAFPVHDARLDKSMGNARYAHCERVLSKQGVMWHNLSEGESLDV